MSQNSTLSELRKVVAKWRDLQDRLSRNEDDSPTEKEIDSWESLETVADLVCGIEHLDKWLSKGGVLPDAWNVGVDSRGIPYRTTGDETRGFPQ